MRSELTDKRTARSKTFDNGDGTLTLESGGPHVHHRKGGVWVDTDTYLYPSAIEIDGEDYTHATGEHPHDIHVHKSQPHFRVTMLTEDGELLTVLMTPLDVNPVVGVKSLNTVTYRQLWDGLDVKRIVMPEGLVEEITLTSM